MKTATRLKPKELSKLQIVSIPDGVSFYIDDYDGMESIHEDHRSWE